MHIKLYHLVRRDLSHIFHRQPDSDAVSGLLRPDSFIDKIGKRKPVSERIEHFFIKILIRPLPFYNVIIIDIRQILGCNPVINSKEEIDRSTLALSPAQEILPSP